MTPSMPDVFYALVLDDDPDARESFALLLERLSHESSHLKGLRVLKAQSRNEAVQQLEKVGVDMNTDDLERLRRAPLALAVVDQNLEEDVASHRLWGDKSPGTRQEGVAFAEWLKGTLLPPRVVVVTAHAHTAETAGFAFAKSGADAYEGKHSSRARMMELFKGAIEDFLSIDYPGFGHD